MKTAADHLDLMASPLKENGDIPPDDIFAARSRFREFRDKIAENFNDFKTIAFRCYVAVQPFTSDTQMNKILKSFVMSIEDLEEDVNDVIHLFDDLKSKDFIKNFLEGVDKIHTGTEELKDIIENRINGHIQMDILDRNWVSDMSHKLQEKVEKKSPLIMRLVEERENKARNINNKV